METLDGNTINQPLIHYVAELLDGRKLTEVDCPSISFLPLDQVKSFCVTKHLLNEKAPQITLRPNPVKGERIFRVSRTHILLGGAVFRIEICGIKRVLDDGSQEVICTLYWHPEEGLVLTLGDALGVYNG